MSMLLKVQVDTVQILDTQGFQYFSSLSVLHYLHAVLFYSNLNNFYEYLIQHSLKSGGTKDHFRQLKVPGIRTTPYLKAWIHI